jgi:hypothetical protein
LTTVKLPRELTKTSIRPRYALPLKRTGVERSLIEPNATALREENFAAGLAPLTMTSRKFGLTASAIIG